MWTNKVRKSKIRKLIIREKTKRRIITLTIAIIIIIITTIIIILIAKITITIIKIRIRVKRTKGTKRTERIKWKSTKIIKRKRELKPIGLIYV